jgi:hypothetical protein
MACRTLGTERMTTVRERTDAKFSPGRMASTSIKTCSVPKRSVSAS